MLIKIQNFVCLCVFFISVRKNLKYIKEIERMVSSFDLVIFWSLINLLEPTLRLQTKRNIFEDRKQKIYEGFCV